MTDAGCPEKGSPAWKNGPQNGICGQFFSSSAAISRLLQAWGHLTLVAPHCAIPRHYLSDTPLLRAMGFLVSQHGQLGAIPPPPFSGRFPSGEHAKWRCDTPPSKGVSQRYCAIPYENKANGCDTPLCDTISKRYCGYGGVSRTGPLRPDSIFFPDSS